MRPALLGVLAATALVSRLAEAQGPVGHEPRKSPYRDLEFRQELTFFGGQYNAAADPARVAPRDGGMLGAHYEIRLGGPAYFTARVAGVLSDRQVLDPRAQLVNRVVDPSKFSPFLLTDIGFSLNLTGFKSYRRVVPFLGLGTGIGSGFASPDTGGYRFGFPFLLVARPGLKIGAGGRWHTRIEATNYFYRVRYPELYFVKTGADDPVLPPGSERNYWKRNLGLTIGMTRSWGH